MVIGVVDTGWIRDTDSALQGRYGATSRQDKYEMRLRNILVGLLLVLMAVPGAARAADRYWSGAGTWDTTPNTWGSTSGGPYDNATWNSATPDSAFFESSAGTVSLGEPITIKNLNISVDSYIITNNTLTFSSGTITNTGVNVTISSAITGSPTVRANQGSNKKFTFAPSAGTVTLGVASGASDGELVLGGTTSGNSLASSSTLKLRVSGSGSWILSGLASAYEHYIDSGNLIVSTGTLRSNNREVKLSGGTLHYNNAAAMYDSSSGNPSYNGGHTLGIRGGSLDNTSGTNITTSTYNPDQCWSADWTFIGSNGTNSDLNLGTGGVLLYGGDRQVTVQNSATTLTIGGVIQDGGNFYGLIKDGPGTLKLTGNSTYRGDTIIKAGTNIITQPYLDHITSVWVTNGAVLKLDFTGTNTINNFYTNGVAVPIGTVWGGVTSGAPNTTTLLDGGGKLYVPDPAPLASLRYWDGGTSDIGSNGNEISEGTVGTWSTAIKNWDCGVGVGHTNWVNGTNHTAYFGGTAGTVTLAGDMDLGCLYINKASYTIQGNTLGFQAGGAITNNGDNVTIVSAITGSPKVAANQGSNNELIFAPTAGAMALGAVSGSGSIIELGGTTTGNSLASDSNVKLKANGSGTWALNGNATAYEHFIQSGTLIVNALLKCNNRALHFTGGTLVANGTVEVAGGNAIDMSSGATLKGTGVINDGDLPTVPVGATLAPGDPTGTLTLTNNNCTINGTLAIEIDSGESPNVSTLDVDGTLNISAATLEINETSTVYGDLVIATYNTRSGTFAVTNGLPAGATIDYDYNGGTAIALIVPNRAGTIFKFR